MNKYGKWTGGAAENLAYNGSVVSDPEDPVIRLVIDGPNNKGHRNTIFSTTLKLMGAAVGDHVKYGGMVCQDFAVGYAASGGASPPESSNKPAPKPAPKPAAPRPSGNSSGPTLKAKGKHCNESDSKRISMGHAGSLAGCNKLCQADSTCKEFAFKRSYGKRCDLYRAADCTYRDDVLDIYTPGMEQ